MSHSVTAADVARAAAVSRVTVSRVLNNHPNVTEIVRQRVLRVATELGYAQGKTALLADPPEERVSPAEIGFLFVSTTDADSIIALNPFWSHVLAGVEQAARRASLKVSYQSITRNSVRTILSTIRMMGLDGILLVGPADAELVSSLIAEPTPCVLIDNVVPQLAVDTVLSDNFVGGKMAVDYLIGQGHHDIAFIGGQFAAQPPRTYHNATIEQRAAGYRDALYHAGLPLIDDLMAVGELTMQGGYMACAQLIARQVPFSALFCANDEMAIGAIKALGETQRRVPDDISVIGFDDIDLSQHLTPPLTTVHVNKEDMGILGVQILHERMLHPYQLTQQHILPTELIKRATVLPLSVTLS